MAKENGDSTLAQDPAKAGGLGAEQQAGDVKGKGKGKAVEEPPKDAMDEDDDDDEEEEAAEPEDDDDEDADDDMGEIDLNNVVSSRTRGRVIDFAKAAAENPVDDEDEDDEDDDFEEPDDKMDDDKMDED